MPGRLGAGACASEILGIGQSPNVYAITGTVADPGGQIRP